LFRLRVDSAGSRVSTGYRRILGSETMALTTHRRVYHLHNHVMQWRWFTLPGTVHRSRSQIDLDHSRGYFVPSSFFVFHATCFNFFYKVYIFMQDIFYSNAIATWIMWYYAFYKTCCMLRHTITM